MDPEFFRADFERSLQTNITTIVDLLRDVDVNIPDNNAVLQKLLNLQSTVLAEKDAIEEFTFKIPDLTYDDFIKQLGAMKPEVGTHIKEKDGNFYFNNNENSYVTITPAMAYALRRRELLMVPRPPGQPPPPEEELHEQAQEAYVAQEKINGQKLLGIPEWRLLI
jgi:hypothetical protein